MTCSNCEKCKSANNVIRPCLIKKVSAEGGDLDLMHKSWFDAAITIVKTREYDPPPGTYSEVLAEVLREYFSLVNTRERDFD